MHRFVGESQRGGARRSDRKGQVVVPVDGTGSVEFGDPT